MDVTWTRKRLEELVGLRKEGRPPTEIGRGLGFSKNGVIGMPGELQSRAFSDTEFAIGNSRKVRRRGSLLCRAVAHGSLPQPFFGPCRLRRPMM